MTQAPKPKPAAPKGVSQVEALKDKGPQEDETFAELRKQNEELQSQVSELHRVVELMQKGKQPGPKKVARPAGKYRLTSALWDGRVRIEPGVVKHFAEGKAPQSAKLLEAEDASED